MAAGLPLPLNQAACGSACPLTPLSMFYHGDQKVESNPYAHPDPQQQRDAHGGRAVKREGQKRGGMV